MLGGAQWFQLPLWGHKSATQSDTYRRSILSLGFGHLTPGYVHTHLHVFRAISSVYKCLFLLRLESNTLPGSIRSAKHQLKFCTDYQRSAKKKHTKKQPVSWYYTLSCLYSLRGTERRVRARRLPHYSRLVRSRAVQAADKCAAIF